MREQMAFVCRDTGTDCDWEARDSDEAELVASAREHARRRHATELTPERVRTLVRGVASGVGGI